LCAGLGSAAGAATIDFDAAPSGLIAPSTSVTEDGFRFSVVTGGAWGIDGAGVTGNALWIGNVGPIAINDLLVISQVGGGLFTFDGLSYRSGGGASDGINFVGRNGGSGVFSLSLAAASDTWLSLPGRSGPVDEIWLVGASIGDAALITDDYVLTPYAAVVPLPAGVLLLVGGFGALAVATRRRRA
jgi:hypothetical protein